MKGKCRQCTDETKSTVPAELRPGYFVGQAVSYKCRNNHCEEWYPERLLPGEKPLYDDEAEKTETEQKEKVSAKETETPQKSAKKSSASKSSAKKKSPSKKAVKD